MDIFDRWIDTFAKKINYVRRASMGVPKMFTIDLAAPIIDQPYHISGNLFYVWSAPNETSYVDIKVNKSSEPALRCVQQTGLITPFDKLLITTPAEQTGDMVIIYGTEAPEMLELIDNRSLTADGITLILEQLIHIRDQLEGDETPLSWGQAVIGLAQSEILDLELTRKSFSIQSKSTNTGLIYIGFDNTVTAVNWFAELQPGQSCGSDDYLGPVNAIATVAGQLIGYAEI